MRAAEPLLNRTTEQLHSNEQPNAKGFPVDPYAPPQPQLRWLDMQPVQGA